MACSSGSTEAYAAFVAADGRPSLDGWLARAALLGEVVTIDDAGRSRTGTFVGIADDGALLLEEPGHPIRKIVAGDLVRGPRASSRARLVLIALAQCSSQLPLGGVPGRVEHEVHGDPDGPGEREKGHRKRDRQRDGDDFLPNQREVSQIRLEDQNDGQSQPDDFGYDQIQGIGAKKVTLFPLEPNAAPGALLVQREVAVEDAGTSAIRTASGQRPLHRYQEPVPGVPRQVPQLRPRTLFRAQFAVQFSSSRCGLRR